MNQKTIDKEVKNITQQIIKKYKPQKIILFGSIVKGKFTKDSDLDFLVVKKNVPRLGRERAYQLRKLIKKTFPADFLVYQTDEFEKWLKLGDPFLETVLEEGKILYG